MPKLPRAEVSTVAYNPTPQPFSSGDGYAAPGRAMQGLGQAVSQAGAQFQEALSQEDEFTDKLNLLKFTNQQDEIAIKSQAEFNRDDPSGFATEQYGAYKQAADQFIPTLKTKKAQQQAMLHLEQHGANGYERNLRFEYGKRSEKIGGELDATINGQIAQPWASEDLSTVPDEVFGRLQGIDAIVKAAPLQNKEKYVQQAAKLAFDKMRESYAAAGKLEEFYPAVQKLQQRLGQTGQASPQQQSMSLLGGSPIDVAKQYLGKHEARDAEALSSFFRKSGGQSLDPNDTAWCAAFVNAALGASGQKGTGTLLARDFLKFGTETKTPSQGDVVVLSRGDPNGWQGHVGFYAGKAANGNILVLGGNQGNKVSVQEYPAARVLGYRKPPKSGSDLPGLAMPATEPAEIAPKLSAYSPQASGSGIERMEGGYAAAKPGPDGKAEVRTLEDVARGASSYITLAGNPDQYGKSYTIPEITFIGSDGKQQTLKNVRGVVHDTGGRFKTAAADRFDVPVARDIDDKAMASQPFLKSGVKFVPEGASGLVAGSQSKGVQVADASGAVPASAIPGGATNRLPAAPGAAPRASTGVMNETMQYGMQQSDTWAREHMGLQEVWAKKRAAKIGQMIDLSDKGYDVPDNDIETLKREIASKPDLDAKYQLSANLAGVEQAAQLAKQLRQYTPTQLQAGVEQTDAIIRDAAASGKVTTEQMGALVKRKERMDALLRTMRMELDKDPLMWVERSKIDLPVVPGSTNKAPIALERMSPSDPELANKLEVRLDQAERVAAYYQAPLKVFTAVEREAFSNAIKTMGPKALPLLGQMAKSLGPNAVSVINEIMPKEPELARAGYLIASGGDVQAAQDIFATFQRKQDPNYKAVSKFGNNEERQLFSDVVGDLYDRLPSALSAGQEADSVLRAGEAIYEARNKTGKPDQEAFKSAVKLALGERTVNGSTYGGVVSLDAPGWFTGSYKVQVPSNIKQDQFMPLISGIRVSQLKEAGIALPVDAKGPMRETLDFGSMIVERHIVQIGPGKYTFAKGDASGNTKTNPQFMVGEDGKPFVLDINKMLPVLKKSSGASGWILE